MEDIRIYCENTEEYRKVKFGKTLKEIAMDIYPEQGVIAALVDNCLKGMDFIVLEQHNVRFITYDHPDGRRTYIRSLCFVLQNAVSELFPDKILAVDYSLPSGLYCEIREKKNHEDGRPNIYFITDGEIEVLKAKMQEIISRNLPFSRVKMTLEETARLFSAKHQSEKVNLLHSLRHFTYSVYFLDGKADTF